VSLLIPCAVLMARALPMQHAGARRWLWTVSAALIVCLIGTSRTVRLFSPFLVATLVMFVGTAAILLRDLRRPAPGPRD